MFSIMGKCNLMLEKVFSKPTEESLLWLQHDYEALLYTEARMKDSIDASIVRRLREKIDNCTFWVSVKTVLNNDCTRSTSALLLDKYATHDFSNVNLNKISNREVIILLILLALLEPLVEQKVSFDALVISAITACDIATVIKKNFVGYGLNAKFTTFPAGVTSLIVVAQK